MLACKQLDSGMGPAELRHLPRTQAESGLTFAGFAVLACPLKPGQHSAAVLRVTISILQYVTGIQPESIEGKPTHGPRQCAHLRRLPSLHELATPRPDLNLPHNAQRASRRCGS